MRVRFCEVGRGKREWEGDIPDILSLRAGELLCREIKAKGSLASNDIDFVFDPVKGEGVIYAGFHVVGRIERVAR